MPRPTDLLTLAASASPPPKFPPGHFTPLVPVVTKLLDRGFQISQAADWLVNQGVIPLEHREKLRSAMKVRLHRLRSRKIQTAEKHGWRSSLYYDSTHLVAEGELTAVCGARATVWMPETSESNRCARCVGKQRKHGIRTN